MKLSTRSVLLSQFVQLRNELNERSLSFVGSSAYEHVTLPCPQCKYPELDFIRTVSWLYMHHIEAGRVSVKFLIRYFDPFKLDGDHKKRNHVNDISRLRTLLQHNLIDASNTNLQTKKHCRNWYLNNCGVAEPINDEQWAQCHEELIRQGVDLLKTLYLVIDQIEKDEDSEDHKEQWHARIGRELEAHEIDRIVDEVKRNLGYEFIDTVKVRSQYLSLWKKQISLLDLSIDLHTGAKNLIETFFVSELKRMPPLNGDDIMKEFGLKPGREVGELRKRVQQIYDVKQCSKDELLTQLRKELSNRDV